MAESSKFNISTYIKFRQIIGLINFIVNFSRIDAIDQQLLRKNFVILEMGIGRMRRVQQWLLFARQWHLVDAVGQVFIFI